MKIQINSDDHVDANEAMAAEVTATIEEALSRFSTQISRVEVHLSDENAGKGGHGAKSTPGATPPPGDKRCVLEARLEGRQPVAVTAHALELPQAVRVAADKMVHRLQTTLGRANEHRAHLAGSPMPGAKY